MYSGVKQEATVHICMYVCSFPVYIITRVGRVFHVHVVSKLPTPYLMLTFPHSYPHAECGRV